MKATASREPCAPASETALWRAIPLELAASTVFIILVAGLMLAGVFP